MQNIQAIAIIHNIGDSPWLQPLLNSIDTDYPLLITNHKGWCMDGIKKIFDTTDYEEIVFMNESMIVKDNSIWDIVFREHKGKSVMLSERYLMFFGKFLRSKISPIPSVKDKIEDVLIGEGQWCRQYMDNDPDYVEIQPLFDNHIHFEEKNGRENMVLENDYFIKWKATWSLDKLIENS